jgi:hypothetical protein
MAGSGSTPPRKGRCGGDDVEDAWLAAEAAKRSHARAAVWGVRLRGHFNTFLLLLLVLLAFLAVSVGTTSGNGGAPQEPSTLSVTTGKGNGTDEPQAPVSSSAMTNKKEISVAPHTPTPLPATKKKRNNVELHMTPGTKKKENGVEPQTPAKKPLPVSIKKGNGGEPRALRATVPSRSDDDATGFGSGDQQQAECDMSSGRWVYDDTAYPLYKESACTFMSDQSACQKFGRTDLRYQHWRWQPHGCDLPRYVRRSSFTCLCFHACRTTRKNNSTYQIVVTNVRHSLYKMISGVGGGSLYTVASVKKVETG